MAFIKVTLDAKEPEAAPEGSYPLRIVKVEEKESSKGSDMIVATIRIEDASVNAPLFNHYVVLPGPKSTNPEFAKLQVQRFLEVFGIPHEDDGFDPDDFQGAEGECVVTQQEGDDGIIRNTLRLPRLA